MSNNRLLPIFCKIHVLYFITHKIRATLFFVLEWILLLIKEVTINGFSYFLLSIYNEFHVLQSAAESEISTYRERMQSLIWWRRVSSFIGAGK